MADVSRAVNIIFRGDDQVSDDIGRISTGLSTIGDSAGSIDADFDNLTDSLDSATDSFELLGLAGSAAGRLIGGALAALSVAELAADFLEVNSAIESFERRLTFAGASSQEIGDQLEYVRGVADRFGIDLQTASDVYGTFIARVGSSGLTIDQQREIFENFSGAILAAGGNTQDVEGAFLQLTQGIARGRFELEDFKGIIERVPDGLKIAADALGITEAGVYDLISASEFGREEIIKFADALGERVPERVEGYNAALGRLSTAYQELLISFGETGAFDLVTSGIEGLTTVVENAGSISGWSFVADGFTLIKDAINSLLGDLESGNWELLTGIFGDVADEIERLNQEQLDAIGVDLGLDSLEKLGDEWDRAAEGARIAQSVSESFWASSSSGATTASKSIESVTESTLEAAKAANELQVSLEQIASDERISSLEIRAELQTAQLEADTAQLQARLESINTQIEFQAAIDIAQIEADTQRIQAAFESLNNSISVSGELLNNLYGQLGSTDGLREEFRLERYIEREQDRLDEQLELQKRLTDAQIREINARAAALEAGDPAITINGDGLQPHLEAFMFEVLEAVQVRTNSEGLALLLGTA